MNINKENIEEHIFDYLEGNLTYDQILEFREYINSNDEAKAELNNWRQTYVSDSIKLDSSEFSNLKKSNSLYYWAAGIAAILLILTGVNWYSNQNIKIEDQPKTESSIIKNESPTINDEIIDNNTEILESNKIELIETTFSKKSNYTKENKVETMSVLDEVEENISISKLDKRNIKLPKSEVDREVITTKNTIVAQEKNTKKKNREVEVIELNSEGF